MEIDNTADLQAPNILQFKSREGSYCSKGGFRHVGPFIFDDKLAMVECQACKAQLAPMHVLKILYQYHEELWAKFKRLKTLIEECKNKLRCKCQKCGELTPIIRES